MTTRDYAAERYNRRTRAIEKQAAAVEQLADAVTVIALAATAQTSATTAVGTRRWTTETAVKLMNRLHGKASDL